VAGKPDPSLSDQEPKRSAGAAVVADRDVLTARTKRLVAFAAGFVAVEHRLSYVGQAYVFRCRKAG